MSILAAAVAVAFLQPLPAECAAPTDPQFVRIAERFARVFPREHISRRTWDDSIAAKAWTNYLSTLDYERLYFLQSDIDQFARSKAALDDAIRQGNVDFAFDVFALYKERVRDRCRFVERLLAQPLDVTTRETYHWKRDKAAWVAGQQEWDDLWRRKIKNEYVQVLVSRAIAEPKTNPAAARVEKNEDDLDAHLSPEAFVLKRYRQVLSVLEDSDAGRVFQQYLTAFAQAYDPHSDYMSPDEVDDFNIEMKLSLVGIGALLRAEDGAAQVVRLVPGGPASRDKRPDRLVPGDKIIAVGQGDDAPEDVLHWPLNKIVSRIRGEQGTRVVLIVIPASDPTGSATKTVDLVRDEVKLEEQAATSTVHTVKSPDGVVHTYGVISLPAFYANMEVTREDDPAFKSSARDVATLVENLLARGVEGLVFDLRSNGGGSLLEAVTMTGLFLDSGPVVQVAERNGTRILRDPIPSTLYDGPMVILVNRLSASASEILAGALADYGRAVVVGDSKTHGKGTVQSIVEMGRDERYGSLRVTSATYYRVTGQSTQLKGVAPDIFLPSAFENLDLGEDSLPNAMECDPIPPVAFEPYRTLKALVPELASRSGIRRAANPRFRAYTNLLNRIRVMNETEEVPLDLGSRRKLAETERELRELQEKIEPESENAPAMPTPGDAPGHKSPREGAEAPAKPAANKDLVLEEGLQILNDLATLRRASPGQVTRPAPPRVGWLERLQDWMRRFP